MWPAAALADSTHFDIQAEPLPAALKAFAQQARMQLLYEYAIVRDLEGSPVVGMIDKHAALRMLLRNTGLRAVFISADAAAIRPIRAAAPDDMPKPAASDNPSSQVTVAKLEEIVVTGSRLLADSGETPEPVYTYSSAQIQSSGQMSLWGFLSTLPDVATTQSGPNPFQTFAGQETVQLHGMPTGTVLVLLNGQRLPDQWYGFFDLGSIPAAAVERIDVLPVGSSAVYGSDAIAGAVNIVLRKAFDGAEADAKYGWANGTHETDVSFDFGHQWPRGAITFVGSFRTNTALLGGERGLTSNQNFTPLGGPNDEQDACSPGNVYSLTGQNLPGLNAPYAGIPAGISGTPTTASFADTAGKLHDCSTLTDLALIGPETEYGGILSGSYHLTDDTRLFTEVLYSYHTLDTPLQSTLQLFGGSYGAQTLGAGNPYNPFGESVGISYAYQLPGQPIEYSSHTQFVRPLIGIDGELGRSWSYQATAAFAQDSDRVGSQTEPNAAAIQEALDSTNPATAFNPFSSAGPGSIALLQSFLGPVIQDTFLQSMYSLQAFVRGPLLTLPSGPVQAVFGGEYDRQRTFASIPDLSSVTTAYRRNWALFGETRVPLLPAAAGTASKLNLSLAGRYDRYDDFGGAATGQAGLEWRPVQAVILRGTYANAYKAPDLDDLYGAAATFDEEITDPRRGNQTYFVPTELGGGSALASGDRPIRNDGAGLCRRYRSQPQGHRDPVGDQLR